MLDTTLDTTIDITLNLRMKMCPNLYLNEFILFKATPFLVANNSINVTSPQVTAKLKMM